MTSTGSPLDLKVSDLVAVHKEIATHREQLKRARKRYKSAIDDVREAMRAQGISEVRADTHVVRTADTCTLNISEE